LGMGLRLLRRATPTISAEGLRRLDVWVLVGVPASETTERVSRALGVLGAFGVLLMVVHKLWVGLSRPASVATRWDSLQRADGWMGKH